MTQRIRDVAVKVDEYQDQYGNTKGRWVNVGALMKGDDGNEFIILNKWFNPAGVPSKNAQSIILSCFKLKDQQGGQQQQPQQPQQPADAGVGDDFDDDIPF